MHHVNFLFVSSIFYIVVISAGCVSVEELRDSRDSRYKQPTTSEVHGRPHSAKRRSSPTKYNSQPRTIEIAPIKSVDLFKLQKILGMSRSISSLGYQEKRFNTCRDAANIFSKQNCQTGFLIVLHLQLLCRDSMGTVQHVSNFSLTPVVSSHVKWKIGSISGFSKTDRDGFGQVLLVNSYPLISKKLLLQVKNYALRLDVKQVKRIIVPEDWCSL